MCGGKCLLCVPWAFREHGALLMEENIFDYLYANEIMPSLQIMVSIFRWIWSNCFQETYYIVYANIVCSDEAEIWRSKNIW